MTVEQYLYFVAKIKGVSGGDRASAVTSAIVRTQLEDKTKLLFANCLKAIVKE